MCTLFRATRAYQQCGSCIDRMHSNLIYDKPLVAEMFGVLHTSTP